MPVPFAVWWCEYRNLRTNGVFQVLVGLMSQFYWNVSIFTTEAEMVCWPLLCLHIHQLFSFSFWITSLGTHSQKNFWFSSETGWMTPILPLANWAFRKSPAWHQWSTRYGYEWFASARTIKGHHLSLSTAQCPCWCFVDREARSNGRNVLSQFSGFITSCTFFPENHSLYPGFISTGPHGSPLQPNPPLAG